MKHIRFNKGVTLIQAYRLATRLDYKLKYIDWHLVMVKA